MREELKEARDGDLVARCYQYCCRIAEKIGIEPSIPRVSGRQIHRANAPSQNIEEHYRRNIGIPYLDHIIVGKIYIQSIKLVIKFSIWGHISSLFQPKTYNSVDKVLDYSYQA